MIDSCDEIAGKFLAILEDEDASFEEAVDTQQRLGALSVDALAARWPGRVIND